MIADQMKAQVATRHGVPAGTSNVDIMRQMQDTIWGLSSERLTELSWADLGLEKRVGT